MNIETLQKFCGKLGKRESIETPWTNGDYTYATDGRILVRVDNHPSARVCEKGKIGLDVSVFAFDHNRLGPPCWIPVPDVVLLSKPCLICQGLGRKICVTCGSEFPCTACSGDGIVFGENENRVAIVEAEVNGVYLKLIKDNLENAEIEIAEKGHEHDPLRFKFDGGLGYLMPMRKPQ
jgi:hypothetical protein